MNKLIQTIQDIWDALDEGRTEYVKQYVIRHGNIE
jgi:hypothetical protein